MLFIKLQNVLQYKISRVNHHHPKASAPSRRKHACKNIVSKCPSFMGIGHHEHCQLLGGYASKLGESSEREFLEIRLKSLTPKILFPGKLTLDGKVEM